MKVLISLIIVVNFSLFAPVNLAKVQEAQQFCINNQLDTNYCVFVDMSIHSGKKRMFVYSFENDSIIGSALTSHGCGLNPWSSDQSKDNPSFSNEAESHLSSLGKYKIGKRGWSNWGININYKLHGLEDTNSNAFKRLIVLHGWNSIPDVEVFPTGVPEGYGCPAVSNNTMRVLDSLLQGKKKDVLLWIYK